MGASIPALGLSNKAVYANDEPAAANDDSAGHYTGALSPFDSPFLCLAIFFLTPVTPHVSISWACFQPESAVESIERCVLWA